MLKKKQRLSTNYEFNITRKHGTYFEGRFFHAYIVKPRNYRGPTKFGIVTSVKLSKIAARRNRAKRLYRQVIRERINSFGEGNWVVIHPKSKSLEVKYEEIITDFDQAIQKISIPN